MSTLIVYTPALAHTQSHHPENATRLARLPDFLDQIGLTDELLEIKPHRASDEQLLRVHTAELIQRVATVSAAGGGLLDLGDTYVTAQSYDLARLAAGGCCAAVDAIMSGQAKNGFALVRPPGHHAERDRASGFCLFNNVAIAARQAQAENGAGRVAIVDFDVHHGNGTQDIFFYDETVLFASTHLFGPMFYPGIGAADEMGAGSGAGFTVNAPLPAGVGDDGYRRIFDEVILPRVRHFKPELLLVSIGFDAHWMDPLASAGLSLTGYAEITKRLIKLADDLCDGRVLFVLEGGYQLDILTLGIINVFTALIGNDSVLDPFGPMPEPEQPIDDMLDHLKFSHLSN